MIVGLVILGLLLLLLPVPVILAAIVLVTTLVAALAVTPVAGFLAFKLLTRSNANKKRKVESDHKNVVDTDEKGSRISELENLDLE